jgi:uncharacterized protein
MQHTITNETLYKMFITGAKSVMNEKNDLNKINVFPVADGDTGTNLNALMSAIIEKAELKETPYETMKSISDAAIYGARGNSGIIFAQYIVGMTKDMIHESVLTLEHLSKMFANAVKSAYQAISNPVEGTMITLMRALSNAIDHLKNKDVIEAFEASSLILDQELKETPEKLEVLKKNNVVDAGAKGFYHFFLGFVSALKNEDVDIVVQQKIEYQSDVHDDVSEKPLKNRYCTEAYIKGDALNAENIREKISQLGDSIVVAGYESALKIHIHTDVPNRFFETIESHGQIIEQKVDDMFKQYETVHERKYPIALITDSIADLPSVFVDQEQIHQIPITLFINDVAYFDKLTIKNERLYQIMDDYKVYPTSAQPNLKVVENYLSFITSYYDEIIIMNVSSKMSGTYGVFEKAAASFPDKKILLVDTKQNSGAEGLMVHEVALWIKAGLTFNQIKEKLDGLSLRTKILVSVPTLKYMVRSGRLKKVTGMIGKVMNLKPVISIDAHGEGIIFDKAFSQKMSYQKIVKHIKEVQKNEGILKYSIVHAKSEYWLPIYEKALTEIIGKAPEYVCEISTVVAMNAGIGSLAVAYIKGENK